MKRFHWHSQNLNAQYINRRAVKTGPKWRHGRGWLNRLSADPDRDGYRWTLGVEWVFPGRSFGFTFRRDDEDDALWLNTWLVSLYFLLDWKGRHFQPDGSKYYPGDREISIRWHSGGLWWTIWLSDHEWRPTDPKWRRGHFNPLDFFLGRHKYTYEIIEERPVSIPMPERSYAGTAKLTIATWKRPRWPFASHLRRVEIDIPDGIPHLGKGENAWDCEDDATFSITTPATSIEDGIGKLVASVMASRRKYGGDDWIAKAPEYAA